MLTPVYFLTHFHIIYPPIPLPTPLLPPQGLAEGLHRRKAPKADLSVVDLVAVQRVRLGGRAERAFCADG